MLFALLSYPILGAGVKYIDDAFDEKIFNRTLAFLVAPILGVLWAYTMLVDPVSATILLAILCGVLLKGKIDNYAHLLGFAIILVIIILTGVHLLFLPLIFLATAAFLDEVGNDLIDQNNTYIDRNKASHRFLVYFFDQRWVMKLAVLCIVFMGVVPIYFFFALLLFDAAYLLVRWYGRSRSTIAISFDLKLMKLKDFIIPNRRRTPV